MRIVPGCTEAPVLITGGAGFIGSNLAANLLAAGSRVVLFDNLSRPGVEQNAAWLKREFGGNVTLRNADIRDADAVRSSVQRASAVFHFAAQVAVTSSLESPVHDFEVNARGTLNVLEAVRRTPVPLVFTSTNKVYGNLSGVRLCRRGQRYEPADRGIRSRGIAEDQSLEFASPYGCSKGAADQYVVDYARVYRLPAVVFRMSCIYGPRQFGTEDQGWVAHFVKCAQEGTPITIYGDGMQVRDLLFVDDLVRAFLLARAEISRIAGRTFNIGGGPANAASLREILSVVTDLRGAEPEVTFDDWRPGDQRYYASDIRAFRRATGWKPRVGISEGLAKLDAWMRSARPVRDSLAA